MSNCERFSLPLVEAEPHQFNEILRCLIHTILFNRALGYVKPVDVDSELFDVTYVQCGDADVARRVETKIAQFCPLAERRPGEVFKLCLSFYEKRKKAAWFGSKDERLYWEQWFINLLVASPDLSNQPQFTGITHSDEAVGHHHLQAAVEGVLFHIADCVNEKRDHIPPVVSSSTVSFPFDISIVPESGSASTFGLNVEAMKRMLLQTTPPQMLGS